MKKKVQDAGGAPKLDKEAHPICGGCGSTSFRYVKSVSGGLIKLECEKCGNHIVVSPPVKVTGKDGTSVQYDFNEGDVKRRAKGDAKDGYVTISLRVPEAVRDRFQIGVQIARALSGKEEEKGMYPSAVIEYMIEEFITTYQGQIPAERLAEIKADSPTPEPRDAGQTDLFDEGSDSEPEDSSEGGTVHPFPTKADPEAEAPGPVPRHLALAEEINATLAEIARGYGLTANARQGKDKLIGLILEHEKGLEAETIPETEEAQPE